jgi:hypothetical protein
MQVDYPTINNGWKNTTQYLGTLNLHTADPEHDLKIDQKFSLDTDFLNDDTNP